MQPDLIFETSWEVCNKVGGIYAVLSTRAASMQAEHPDRVVFFGPDFGSHSDIWFEEDKSVLRSWKPCRPVRIGRWKVPGNPIAVLLRWDDLETQKNDIYAWAWQHFGVQSHAAYGDYDESSLFGYAAGQVMESLYQYVCKHSKGIPSCVVHANEWQTAFALFYVRFHCPKIGTLFTTHATGIGRSIAGNGKPLYDYFEGYHGDQMAAELGIVSKHSVEKCAAHTADCFTTVSDITARECKQLLEKEVDIVTPNGFEQGFVPKGLSFQRRRKTAQQVLLQVAEKAGVECTKDPLLVGISGRKEWKNKGIDVFLDSLQRTGELANAISRQVIAFVMIPYLDEPKRHWGKVDVVFLPYYFPIEHAENTIMESLKGMSYFDLLIGLDLTVFPSYYEPWGYTPLESVAFHVPTITTSLTGFGTWAATQGASIIDDGVEVIARTDSNYEEVAYAIAATVCRYASFTDDAVEKARKAASAIAHKADWKHFFPVYRKAYTIALTKAQSR